jgi:hypothetical protein
MEQHDGLVQAFIQRQGGGDISYEEALQAGRILLVVAIWAGLLVVFLSLTGGDEAPQPTEVVAAPATTQVPPSTEQPSTATHTVPAPTEAPEATSGPTVLPTETGALPSPTDTPAPPGAGGTSFSGDVLPVLTSRCDRCHGGNRIEAGLDLLSYAGVMAGSEDGPVVIPGDSANSSLVQVIISGEMPRRAPRLPDSEIETVANWVDEGALDN